MRTLLLGFMLMFCAGLALADGMLLPVRPEVPAFGVSYHRVNVTLDRQVATTEVDQAFLNRGNRQVEGTYIFPILDGMTISKFSMYAGNEELTHRILEKEEARRIYTGIVSKRQDPALLEWLGYRMIQARVFPIEPNQEKRIRLSYQEVVSAKQNVVKYVYPLKTEKVSATPLRDCSVTIRLRAAAPLRNIYSPTHAVTIERKGEHEAVITYREKNVLPDQDLVLYYATSPDPVGVDLLAYREPGAGDGYFLLLASPRVEVTAEDVQPKDVVFVLDTSGSMQGEKLVQAKAALQFCLNSLDARDRFNVIAFSTEVNPWRREPQTAAPAHLAEATTFIKGLTAIGGTNIHGALETALHQLTHVADAAGRPPVVVFLTDGLPTIGETSTNRILTAVKTWNTRRVRLFNFGVGADYNAHFLDKLGNANYGDTENVLPKEDIEVKVSDFYTKIATPMLMNLALDWGGMEVADIYPKQLPDLFKGSQLIIAGRYKAAGAKDCAVRLSGDIAGKRQSFTYTLHFPASSTDAEHLPRLWATRKIGYLEEQLRLHGMQKEMLEELITLSKTYGVLSQYTSFLVDLDVNAPPSPIGAVPNAQRDAADLMTAYARSVDASRGIEAGIDGARQSRNTKLSAKAEQVKGPSSQLMYDEAGNAMQVTSLRNVNQRSFVQAGAQWVDTQYSPKQPVVKVRVFSAAYFQLANAHPQMARFMSVGHNVTVALRDTAVQVSDGGQETEFTTAEMKDLSEQMNASFGMPEDVKTTARPDTPVAHATGPLPLLFGMALLVLRAGWRSRRRESDHANV
ncbi:MAG: von Willebrand factor type A domain protein [bacterium ADurb.Bin429]|nr:MAG: von Willebrand factor type A domain protein [bacterium ADurb.Bin429]